MNLRALHADQRQNLACWSSQGHDNPEVMKACLIQTDFAASQPPWVGYQDTIPEMHRTHWTHWTGVQERESNSNLLGHECTLIGSDLPTVFLTADPYAKRGRSLSKALDRRSALSGNRPARLGLWCVTKQIKLKKFIRARVF